MVLQIHAAPRLEFSLLQPIFAKRFQDVKKVSSIDLRHGEGLFPNLYLKSSVRCSRARSPVTRRVPCILSNHNECSSPSAPAPPPTSLAIALMRQWRWQQPTAAAPAATIGQTAVGRRGAGWPGQCQTPLRPSASPPLVCIFYPANRPPPPPRRRSGLGLPGRDTISNGFFFVDTQLQPSSSSYRSSSSWLREWEWEEADRQFRFEVVVIAAAKSAGNRPTVQVTPDRVERETYIHSEALNEHAHASSSLRSEKERNSSSPQFVEKSTHRRNLRRQLDSPCVQGNPADISSSSSLFFTPSRAIAV